MTRGNQRDKAREKNMKKQKDVERKKGSCSKDGNKGMSLEDRRQRDAEIMRQKQDKKLADAGAGSGAGAGASADAGEGASGGTSK